MGRCKLCRSKAKYLPGQGSLDAVSSRIFRRRGPESLQRAASAEPGEPPPGEGAPPPAPRSPPPTPRPHTLHRQHRLEVEDPLPPSTLPLHHTTNDHFPDDIRGYRHIPGPPPDLPHAAPGLLVGLPQDAPPVLRQRSAASPLPSPGEPRAPGRTASLAHIGRVHSAPPAGDRPPLLAEYPMSPPPSYEDVLKQPRGLPPSYDASQQAGEGWEGRRGVCRAGHSLPGRAPMARAPAQDIPDIYWEQAARELDFCTCRKCQVGAA